MALGLVCNNCGSERLTRYFGKMDDWVHCLDCGSNCNFDRCGIKDTTCNADEKELIDKYRAEYI